MSSQENNTALLVFIRESQFEAQHKVFAEHIGIKENQRLADILNRRITKLCKETGIPTYVYDNSQQKGETFGERIANAFEFLYGKGFENVIAVGNDCLDISKETIYRAESVLRENQMVLGPAADGGLYLIGLSKAAYLRKRFVQFDWTTERLSQDFLDFAEKFDLSVEIFDSACDIDDAKGFAKALRSLPHFDILKKTLENILRFSAELLLLLENTFKKTFHIKLTSLRAPPH